MIEIKVLEDFRSEGRVYKRGEIFWVDEEAAKQFCESGWASSESFATGKRETGPSTLDVQSSVIGRNTTRT